MTAKKKPETAKRATRGGGKPGLRFYQLDIDFDDRRIRYSTWGSVQLRFVGRKEIIYFNLAVEGTWAVRNVPVLSREGPGKRQETWFSFPLGNREGERVRKVEYGYSLTGRPTGKMPPMTANAAVTQRLYRLRRGTGGPRERPQGITPQSPKPVEGGEVKGPKATHDGFPNQPCGPNECVPTAISNSLKFLNKKHKLDIPDDDISIDKLKKPTGWHKQDGCPDGWEDGKKDYVDSENKKTGKKKWPVDTTVPNQPTQYAQKIYDAIRRGCDVEIIANGHCVAVTGAQELKNGWYTLDLTHDSKQQKKKGEGITETVTYNPKTNTVLAGSSWITNQKLLLVVIECPKKKP
ncbi:MAG TPA: hypothetical protein VK335_18050 [Bryobacteraceae bacterium]|nr:hypothetical protein [Bryobacteraceae bacterium]